jgi:hypothetical protein
MEPGRAIDLARIEPSLSQAEPGEMDVLARDGAVQDVLATP